MTDQMAETLATLADFLAAQGMPVDVQGDRSLTIRGVATLEDAGPDEISFLANQRYEKLLATSRAGVVVVSKTQSVPNGRAVARVADPYAAITALIIRLHGYRTHPGGGIHRDAVIDSTAKIGENAAIMQGVTIGPHVTIGRNVVLYPGVFIAAGTRLGDDCVFFPNVVIYDGSRIGHRVTIHANSVIGEDGLGYAPVGPAWQKIPQVGSVEIGDDVEIGAGCTID